MRAFMITRFTPVLIGLALVTAGCDKPVGPTTKKTTATKPPTKTPAKTPPKPNLTPPKAGPPVYYSGAHILIGYKGARRSKATRTKEEALKMATKVAADAKKDPTKFAELAKKHSEGPSGPQGGDLGTWQKGRMVPVFDKAVSGLTVGAVSDPVESPFGYHVIIRKKTAEPQDLMAQQLVVVFKESRMAQVAKAKGKEIKRDKAAAKKLAETLRKQALKAPDKFEALIKKKSDGPRADKGGMIGPWHTLKSRMPPVFTKAVAPLKVGEISEVVESPFGYHVFKRLPPPPTYAGAHILIAYKGARNARANITRSKPEALKEATALYEQLKKEPAKFTELAAKKSNGPSAARGGSLGTWTKGKMVPVFDEAVEKLKIGEISKPVESPFGYHVIRRDDPEKK